MMELFDKKFVYFMWDDELEGKEGFFADSINVLGSYIEDCDDNRVEKVSVSNRDDFPFCNSCGVMYRFFYYDPNYEVKKAFNEGKKIQFCHRGDHSKWYDDSSPSWEPDCEFRIKPEEKEYRPYESSAEMIADFIDRFKVKCPSYCEPLIWVRLKVDKRKRLIVAYGDNFVEIGNKTKAVTLQHLFEQYEFLDGCVIGVKND